MVRCFRARWSHIALLLFVAVLHTWTPSGAGQFAAPPFTELFPPAFQQPEAVISDPAGNLWFAEPGADRIGRLTASGDISHFNLPEPVDRIESLIIAPDGALWFLASYYTRSGADFIGRVTPNGQIFTRPIPDATGSLRGLTVGPDTSLWIATSGGEVFQMTVTGNSTLKHRVPQGALTIIVGPDGNFWLGYFGRIVRLTPSGDVTEFPLPSEKWEIYSLTTGPDNTIWFIPARVLRNLAVAVRLTTDGTFTEFPINAPGLFSVGDILAAEDGQLWLTLTGTNLLGTLAPDGTLGTLELPPDMRVTSDEVGEYRRVPSRSTERLARGPRGSLWFTRGWRQPSQIGRVTHDDLVVSYPLEPGLTPHALVVSPNRTIWFTEDATWHNYSSGATRLGRYTLGGKTDIVHDSEVDRPPLHFNALTADTNGPIWATAKDPIDEAGQIVQLTPSGQVINRYPVKYPAAIVVGPDGALWFTRSDEESIGRLTIDGQVSYIRLNTRGMYPRDIAVGPDSSLWITGSAYYDGEIWSVTPAGEATRYELPRGVVLPGAIVAGPDGNMWFTADMAIGKITRSGQVTTYRLTGHRPPMLDYVTTEYVPPDITVGPDGNLWYIRYHYQDIPAKLGRITTSGEIEEFDLPASGSGPTSLVAGPDGNLYIAARGIRQLIKVDLNALTGFQPSPSPSPAPSLPPPPTSIADPIPPVAIEPIPTPNAMATPIPVADVPSPRGSLPSDLGLLLLAVTFVMVLPIVVRRWQRSRSNSD